ncbi:MAG: DinB family protein [Deltaproteobacteria bacterium]|nr:DinB family protein [Deltaproteobacteria bacterium]
MATSTGEQLAAGIREKIAELKKVCEGVDEGTAARAPAGRWSPKEILSHLLGPEEKGHLPALRLFLDQDTPMIGLDPGNPHFTAKRARMTFRELFSEAEKEYERVCGFVEGLSAEQLGRKAHVPVLKDSPFGEYPTLEGWIIGILDDHIQFHTGHLREILQQLGTPPPPQPAG